MAWNIPLFAQHGDMRPIGSHDAARPWCQFGQWSGQSIFSSAALMEEANLIAPPGALFAQALRQKGWPLSPECITFTNVEKSAKSRAGGQQ